MDITPGDRRSGCRQPMEPISIWVKPDGEWSLIHRCSSCGFLRLNRLAGDDNEQALFQLALAPQQHLPFPADLIEREAHNDV